jgi:hypothetical protein
LTLISADEAAAIIGVSTDELLFIALTEKKVNALVCTDTMAWQFNLADVLELKRILENGQNS